LKLAILGGSFNPVHNGHLHLAEMVRTAFSYDRIILIPAYRSPFKLGAGGPSPADRLDMLSASVTGIPWIGIDDCEIRREGVSFTIDTIDYIYDRYRPGAKPGLILGDDLAANFFQWRRASEIAEKTDIIIARRTKHEKIDFPYPYRDLNNTRLDISSNMIRELIQGRSAWRFLVPPSVRRIIEAGRLYGCQEDAVEPDVQAAEGGARGEGASEPAPCGSSGHPSWETIVRIEEEVRNTLSQPRFLHSRNTALLSWDLCGRYGLDRQAGYLAGIGHDICKSCSDDKLVALALADGQRMSKLEKKKPSLLHGRAAAVLLKQRFGIHNNDILEAVRLHTIGGVNMGDLGKVLYIADKLEVSRRDVDPVLRELCSSAGLEELFAAVLDNTVAYLRSQDTDISYGTIRLLAAMQKRKKS
jgi:nicotinate-nucleotide adenylyltransferase